MTRCLRRALTVLAVTALTLSGAFGASAQSPPLQAKAAMTRGMLAVADGQASTGPYGAPLINGCAWATWVPRCQNLTVYGNGSSFSDSGCGPPNGCTFGPEFQCTELAQRYAYYAWGEPATWDSYGGADGSAAQMWQAGPALPLPLLQFAQGGGVPPQRGDLLIFGPGWLGSYWDGNGHVAVVNSVGSSFLTIVQENGTPSGTDTLALSGSTVSAYGYTPVIGWLHDPMMSSTAISKISVAASAQQQLVFWKGADGHLREAWSTGGTWNGPADWTTMWNGSAILTSAPAAVSTRGGWQNVFWRGNAGHLWQATYDNGWTAPVDLSTGWASDQLLLSAPAAAISPDGQQIVFWQGANGDLNEIWTSGGSWSGPADWSSLWGGGTPLSSPPTVVVTATGIQTIFWRSIAGHLMSVSYAGAWSRPTDVISRWSSQSLMASAPSAVVTADGTKTVVWRAADGRMWGAWYNGSWNGPSLWDGLGLLQSAPSAGLSPSGQAMVYWQGPDGGLMSAPWTNAWNGPADLTSSWGGVGLLGGAPSIATTAAGQQIVFWRGSDGHLWESWSSGTWNGPVDWTTQWHGAGALASAPSVAVTPAGQQIVFWSGTNGHLWEASWNGTWSGPIDWTAQWGTTSALGSAPAVAVTRGGGQQLVFWRGVEGDLWEAWFDGSWNGPLDWSNQLGRTEPLASGPTVAVTPAGQQIVFWSGTNGHLAEAWYQSGWNGPVDWTANPSPTGLLSSAPAVAVTPANEQLVFWQGANGHLWETWWGGAASTPLDWASAHGISDELASSPVAAVGGDGQQVVFWRSPLGHLMEVWGGAAWGSIAEISSIGQLI